LHDANPQIFRNEFAKLSTVQKISMSSNVLGLDFDDQEFVLDEKKTDSIGVASMSVDENFIDNFGLHIIAGKNFGANPNSNVGKVIVNEEMLKKLGIDDSFSAIGKSLLLNDGTEISITGVVRNFHYTSLRNPIGAFFFRYDPARFRYANLSVSSQNRFEDFSKMEKTWATLGSNEKFKAEYFTNELREAYSFYFIVIKLWGFLGLLAITVACIGLLGTVAFTVRNRVKEVSVRKVMGASSESLCFCSRKISCCSS
jgi:putative ABC transport system permease protein